MEVQQVTQEEIIRRCNDFITKAKRLAVEHWEHCISKDPKFQFPATIIGFEPIEQNILKSELPYDLPHEILPVVLRVITKKVLVPAECKVAIFVSEAWELSLATEEEAKFLAKGLSVKNHRDSVETLNMQIQSNVGPDECMSWAIDRTGEVPVLVPRREMNMPKKNEGRLPRLLPIEEMVH